MEFCVTELNSKIGMIVKRNPEYWCYGNQDFIFGKKSFGKIISEVKHISGNVWVEVEWISGAKNSYRVGRDRFDLLICDVKENEEVFNWFYEKKKIIDC